MPPSISSIWHQLPSDLEIQTENCVRTGCEQAQTKGTGTIFFRADDVAVPGKRFARMMGLFSKYGAPLSLAVVPAWLTRDRWRYLKGFEEKNPSRWCWYQHGWRHVNYESEGKKQEFGNARALADIRRDLARGKNRLEQLVKDRFYPVFTPPWNRCSARALQELKDLGYVAVSRSYKSKPPSPAGLPDYYVNIDLHTRKERDPVTGWRNLFREFKQALASNYCGIMIHHQMMNKAAFDFLEVLLKTLINQKNMQIVNIRHLVENHHF
jgi:peptidoglycan/xylan/chitin deacetylase (PgdA/CDA1 family)